MDQEGHIIKDKNVRIAVRISLYAIFIGLTVAVIYIIGSRAFEIGNAVFNEQSMDRKRMGREVIIVIDEDKTSDDDIAHTLTVNHLVKDEFITKLQIKLSDYKGKFKKGRYTLSTEMKPTELFEALVTGKDESEE